MRADRPEVGLLLFDEPVRQRLTLTVSKDNMWLIRTQRRLRWMLMLKTKCSTQ